MTDTPSRDSGTFSRNAANEETTVLTPISDGTSALDRIPVKRQRLWIIVTSLLGVLLIAAGFVIYHLAGVSNEWDTQVEDVVARDEPLLEIHAQSRAQLEFALEYAESRTELFRFGY